MQSSLQFSMHDFDKKTESEPKSCKLTVCIVHTLYRIRALYTCSICETLGVKHEEGSIRGMARSESFKAQIVINGPF